jgi:hypothetical protein
MLQLRRSSLRLSAISFIILASRSGGKSAERALNATPNAPRTTTAPDCLIDDFKNKIAPIGSATGFPRRRQ